MFDKCSMAIAKSDAISDHPSSIVPTYDAQHVRLPTHFYTESRQWLRSSPRWTWSRTSQMVHRMSSATCADVSNEEVLAVLLNRPAGPRKKLTEMTEESPEITYERWYPDVPPVMDSQELAELLWHRTR